VKRWKRKSLNSTRRRRKRMALVREHGPFCQACCGEFPFEELTLDHIRSLHRGGNHKPENLQLLCQPCNIAKGPR